MEGWLYGLFALIGVLFGGIFSYLGMKKQVEHSDKRFEKELERARESESRQRRWVVRSEPLLKLRTELAQMATKQETLIYAAEGQVLIASTETESESRRASDDLDNYIKVFQQSLNLQFDLEIVKLVNEIMGEYHKSQIDIMQYDGISADKLTEPLDVCKRNKTKIAEVQELINKRLEEL